jgi:hypothetical protein
MLKRYTKRDEELCLHLLIRSPSGMQGGVRVLLRLACFGKLSYGDDGCFVYLERDVKMSPADESAGRRSLGSSRTKLLHHHSVTVGRVTFGSVADESND